MRTSSGYLILGFSMFALASAASVFVPFSEFTGLMLLMTSVGFILGLMIMMYGIYRRQNLSD
jgi:Na+-transporting NADH:ubiquinone oxidoreductase subunit NqrD